MAKASIRTDEAGQAVHTRTTAGSEESQVSVLGIDGSDDVVPADRTNGLSVNVTNALATAAKQDTIIGHVDGIEGLLASLAALVDGVEASLTAIDTAARATQAAAERLDDTVSGAGVNQTQVGGQAVDLGAGNVARGTQRVALASDQAAVAVTPAGNVAHDAADSGSPVKVGGRARTALPAAVAQDDRSDAILDKFGRSLALVAPLDQRRSGTQNFTGTSGADVIAAPGASVAIVVTRILVVNGHASVGTKVSVRDGTTVKIVGYAAAIGGGWTVEDPNGLFVATANTAVTAICGTTGADVDVTVFGYTIPA